MAVLGSLKDAGTKSGMFFCGKLRLYTGDKQDWIDAQVDENGDLSLVNKAGETATVDLS